MPNPFDFYEKFQIPTNRADPLSRFEQRLILSIFPQGAQISKAAPARDWGFYPIRVLVHTNHGEQVVFLRKDAKIGGVELEAALLPVLAKLGLPVPQLLAGPALDPASDDAVPVTVLSALPEESLLGFSWEAKGNNLYIPIHLVLAGVARLHAVTSALQQEPIARRIPVKTLMGEWQDIESRGGAWLAVAEFRQALARLEKVLPSLELPLVFSNGDYNPGNFLFSTKAETSNEEVNHSIGNPGSLARLPHQLSGFVDFSWACFEDPHIGFAKYWTYDWFPAGLVERYCWLNQVTVKEFAPRLALRVLWTLQREVDPPQIDPRPSWYRDNLLGLLENAVASCS